MPDESADTSTHCHMLLYVNHIYLEKEEIVTRYMTILTIRESPKYNTWFHAIKGYIREHVITINNCRLHEQLSTGQE